MVLIIEQMELIEGRSSHLPMVFLVHVAKCDGIGEKLIEVLRAGLAGLLGKPKWECDDRSIQLTFLFVLLSQWPHAIKHVASFRSMVLHRMPPYPSERRRK